MRPLENAHFCPSSRKVKILTAGILNVFLRLKFKPDTEIGPKGAFCKGLVMCLACHSKRPDVVLDIWSLVSNMSQVIKNGNCLRVHGFKLCQNPSR